MSDADGSDAGECGFTWMAAWIREQGWADRVLPTSSKIWAYRQENPLPVAPPPEPPNVISMAGGMLDSEKVWKAQNAETAWGLYVNLLMSGGANPQDAASGRFSHVFRSKPKYVSFARRWLRHGKAR